MCKILPIVTTSVRG